LAMQAKIPDSSALHFSRRFYERLTKGRPIDRALRKVRQDLFLKEFGKTADWAMPVLFLGAKDGKLFSWFLSWRSALLVLLALSSLGVAWLIKPWKPHCPTPKAVDMEFVWIEPTPGSKISQPYCLGKYEVSRGEWEAVMGANSLPKGEEDADLPAGVSYTNAQKFIRKLNEKEDKAIHRLPTEAEWEHAAMGPGKSLGGNCKSPDGYEGLAPVGTFRTNDWDLYDMVGNVWEWVEAPDVTQEERVRRGGSWESADASCKLTTRKRVKDWNRKDTGFRVLRELPK